MPKCTECGKEFNLGIGQIGNYMYRQSTRDERECGKYTYQCSYTCWNHAKLRKSGERKHMTTKNYERDVKMSEEVMTHQGKTILYPIKL